MGQLDLNLSTRPFKPYRAVNLGLMVLLLVLVGISAYQIYSWQQYTALAAPIREEERQAREEAESLAREVISLNAKMSGGGTTAKLSEVEFLNALLVRKSFSWSKLFASLEHLLPDEVHLLGLRPFTDEEGKMGINMLIRARSIADAAAFVRILEKSGIYDGITVAVEEKRDQLATGEVEVTLGAYYFPDRSSE